MYNRLPLTEKNELVQKTHSLISPRNLVFISQKKTGKTLTAANKNKILILDCENGTNDYGFPIKNKVDLLKTEEKQFENVKNYGLIPYSLYETVEELKKANDMKTYWELLNELDKNGNEESYKKIIAHINKMPFPIVMIDTITSFVDLSNKAALQEYNSSVKPESRKNDIKKVDDYGGVRLIRAKFDLTKSYIEKYSAPFIIYAGHIAEKKKIFKKSEEDNVSVVDIDLEGLLSKIFTVKASAIGIFNRTEEGCFIDFGKKEESDLGIRCSHLSNKCIKIADFIQTDDFSKGILPKTYWSSIYTEIENLD